MQGDDEVARTLGTDGAVVDEGWAEEQGLQVGDAFTLTSATGDELDLEVRGIEHSPVIDIMGLGPVTIGPEAYASAFGNDRAFSTFATPTRRRRWPATRTPRAARPRRSWTSSSRA